WMLPWPRPMATPMAIAMATTAHTVASRPTLMPESTVVAGPVRAASAISCTGAVSVDVKYSVRRLTNCASTKPATTAQKTRRLCTYHWATQNVPATVRTPAVRKPRLIGAMAERSLSVARTAYTPTIDARTPMARAITGKMTPSAGFRPIDLNAAKPRMIDATRVTSYDSKRSAAIPAQSPTLSPTLSAMVAAFRGSSPARPGY